MSKEWIEDKKKQLENATVFINENGNEAVEISLSVLNKLFEQAEQVQELENTIKAFDHSKTLNATVAGKNHNLRIQNKRYREKLEHIANKPIEQGTWTTQGIDCVLTARKALEGLE